MSRTSCGSEESSFEAVTNLQRDSDTHPEVKIPRSTFFSAQTSSLTSDSEEHPSHKLLLIPELDSEKFQAQLEDFLGADYAGNAIVLDNHNKIYYVKNGVLECKERVGIDQKEGRPLTAKLSDRDKISFCSFSWFGSGLQDVSRSRSAKKIIEEAIIAQKGLAKRIVRIVSIDERLEKIKNSFHESMKNAILKPQKKNNANFEKHPFSDLQEYEIKVIVDILYKEKVEETLSSDKSFSVARQVEYKLTNSPLSKISIWCYNEANSASLAAVYKAIEKRVKKHFVTLFLSNVPLWNLEHTSKKISYDTIVDYIKNESLRFSDIFLRYLELFYKTEIRKFIQANDLASAVAFYNGLKQLPIFFNEKFLTELHLMIGDAANKVQSSSDKFDAKVLSKITSIQEDVDAYQKTCFILNEWIKQIPNHKKKIDVLQKEMTSNNFVTPNIKRDIYDHLKEDDEIIIELIFELAKHENNKDLKNKSKAEQDECTFRIYLLFLKLRKTIIDKGSLRIQEDIITNKDKYLMVIEDRIEELLCQKNQLINDLHQHMNSYVINKPQAKAAKPKLMIVPDVLAPEKKSIPPEKPRPSQSSFKQQNFALPSNNLTFVGKLVKIFWHFVQWLTSSRKKVKPLSKIQTSVPPAPAVHQVRVEQSPKIHVRVYGSHAVHYVTTKNIPQKTVQKPQKLATHRSVKPKLVSNYDMECSEILSMPSYGRFFGARKSEDHGPSFKNSCVL